MSEHVICVSGLPDRVSINEIKVRIANFGEVIEFYPERYSNGSLRIYVKLLSPSGLKKICACMCRNLMDGEKVSVKPVAVIPLALMEKSKTEALLQSYCDVKMLSIGSEKSPSVKVLPASKTLLTDEDNIVICISGINPDSSQEDVSNVLTSYLGRNFIEISLCCSDGKMKAFAKVNISDISIGQKRLCAQLTKVLSTTAYKVSVKIVPTMPSLNSSTKPCVTATERPKLDDQNSTASHLEEYPKISVQPSEIIHYDPTREDHSKYELDDEKSYEKKSSCPSQNIKSLIADRQDESGFKFDFGGSSNPCKSSGKLGPGSKRPLMFDLPTARNLHKVQFFNPEPVADIIQRARSTKKKFSHRSQRQLRKKPFWSKVPKAQN